jgi:hypothetical protein
MATLVKNTGRVAKQVGIILANGKKTTIRVMHRSRKGVELPPGAKIDGNWLALNGKGILVYESAPAVTNTAPAPKVTAPTAPVVEAAEPTAEAPAPDTKTESA